MRPWLPLLFGFSLARPAPGQFPERAEEAHGRAVRFLEQGDARAAEAAAREALAASDRFVAEQEIGERPEKGLLFEDMIAQARSTYRARRAGYFLILGRALGAQERWLEARKALRRTTALAPTSEAYRITASHSDLTLAERIQLLLDAYFAFDADKTSIEQSLQDTGAFRSPDALQAVIDHKRLSLEVVAVFPTVDARASSMAELRAVTDSGPLVSTEILRQGGLLVLYLPSVGCERCSEELDGLHRGVRQVAGMGRKIVVAALVKETDLVSTRRIGRLLAMKLEVGPRDALPPTFQPVSGSEVLIIDRGGLLSARIPIDPAYRSVDIQRRVEAVIERLEPMNEAATKRDQGLLMDAESLEKRGREKEALLQWIKLATNLEAGPQSIDDIDTHMERLARSVLGSADRAEAIEILQDLGGFRGAGRTKARALSELDGTYGRKLLDAARRLDPGAETEPPASEGAFSMAFSKATGGTDGFLLLQRTLVGEGGPRDFDFILAVTGEGMEVLWSAPGLGTSLGAQWTAEGAAFFHEKEGCRGVRLVRDQRILYEGCPALRVNGRVVERRPVLVDPVEPAPWSPAYDRPVATAPETPETALERGKRLFSEQQYRAAESEFLQAGQAVDPIAPYDEVDLRYNRARTLEEQGRLQEALELFRSIGDVAYQDLVDEAIRALESGGRR